MPELKPPSITINVTQRDIKQGERASCNKCPVALALSRHFRGIDVGVYSCSVFHEYKWLWVRFPPKASKFILDFDANKHVEPFNFNLKLVNMP